jgi:hypothetical protein
MAYIDPDMYVLHDIVTIGIIHLPVVDYGVIYTGSRSGVQCTQFYWNELTMTVVVNRRIDGSDTFASLPSSEPSCRHRVATGLTGRSAPDMVLSSEEW